MTVAIILITLLGARFGYLGRQSRDMLPDLGYQNGQLKKCPAKPNCVVSFYSDDKEHFIEPVQIDYFPVEEIKKIIKDQSGEVIEIEEYYIHALFESKIFGFVDDVEFFYLKNVLYFRSASRVGYSDLGVNRKRVEFIKYQLGKLTPKYR